MALNCGAQPDFLPWLKFEVTDLKVTDPAAADPNALVTIMPTGRAFKITLTVAGQGSLWPTFAGVNFETVFYANALGIDVAGERNWHPPAAPLTLISPGTYTVSFTVAAGMGTQGVYEFGAVTSDRGTGINGFCEALHVEFYDL